MKRILKNMSLILCLILFAIPILTLAACDFTVDYKTTSDKLNASIKKIEDSASFGDGNIELELFDGEHENIKVNYSSKFLPNLTFGEEFKNSYKDINDLYNTIFAFSMNYVESNAAILSTKPNVKTLSERQENLYENLDRAIDKFSNGISKIEKEVSEINHYYSNKIAYGESSEEVYLLNFKKAYRDFIYIVLNLSNAIDDVTADIYTEFDYIEYMNKHGSRFKSLENGINIKVFEGYFEFLIDAFDCRVPSLAIDANGTMEEVVSLYNSVKVDYKNLFKKYIAHTDNSAHLLIESCLADDSLGLTVEQKAYLNDLKDSYGQKENMRQEDISNARKIVNAYFGEMELYRKSYKNLGFGTFYFDNDCDLDGYISRDSANKNRYEKIKDYLVNVLPNFVEFIDLTFFTF